ncbi:asparagine synthase (glutamine-hydrolyzing) [Sphingobacteriaceae bacterium]|nr:asparagine synthase (glutamine-hydrolyzing) [Sphingobacteriaceae bacterium]
MCGITGIISLNGSPLQPEQILSMTDEVKHRGPDGEGFLFTNNADFANKIKNDRNDAVVISKAHAQSIALGHRRLSIVDLHLNAAQPMSELTERYWIVYNGEIYNHLDLRSDLEKAGYKFKTDHSDTEVILNAFDYWGVECLNKFNGMWSFCIWDTRLNKIFIARDMIGKKPLYYTVSNKTFYFASELKALLVNKDIKREIDPIALYDYLTYLAVPSPNTVFTDIKKLPAAHYLYFTPGDAIELKQYWSPFRKEGFLESSEEEIIDTLKIKLDNSIKLRFRADVEVGLLLSGGLDSSINLFSLSKYSSKPVKAFSVGFHNSGAYKNEFEYARRVATKFNADYHELAISDKEFIDFFPEMVYYQDEPIGDPANIPIYYVSKVARAQGVKVLLGGEGSDELFIGYQLWNISRQFQSVMNGRPHLARVAEFFHRNFGLKNKRPYYHSWYQKIKSDQPVFWSGTELRSEHEKKQILSRDFLARIAEYNSFNSIESVFRSFQKSGNSESYDWMTSADIHHRLPDMLLARLDRMTMAASVEGRNPFLDIDVVDYAMRIPPHLKSKNNQDKYILKKAYEGIIPDEIIYRKKDSFSVPLERLFSNKDFKNTCIDAVESFNRNTNTFSAEYLQRLKAPGNSNELWNVSNLAMWYKKFIE